MRYHRFLPLTILLLAGCDGGSSCPEAGDGEMIATVDGADWLGAASWSEPGTGVQVSANNAEWTVTLVAQTTTDGTDGGDALDGGEFDLTTGGFATVYPAGGGASFSTRDGSGTLTLDGTDGANLSGCFTLEAVNEGGSVTITDGAFTATPL